MTVWDNPKTVVQARQGDVFAWGVRHGAIGAEYVRTHLATRPVEVSA